MVGRYMIYGIDYVGGTFANVVNFIEAAHNDTAACLIGFAPMSSAMEAAQDDGFREVLNGFDIVAMDGAGIVKKVKDGKFWSLDRCSGPDVMAEIMKRTAYSRTSHFLYGTDPETLAVLKGKLEEEGATIAGCLAPPYRSMEQWRQLSWKDPQLYQAVRESHANYVWVALGAPKQEYLCYAAKEELPGVKIMAVGAAFNFLAGKVPRAPESWQKFGMEWLWRVIHEPKQITRYIRSAAFWLFAKP